MKKRFTGPHVHYTAFSKHLLLHCPKCNSCMEAFGFEGRTHTNCFSCGDRSFVENIHTLNKSLPEALFLKKRCAGNLLWAYNDAHLAYLKSYIEAELREQGIPSTSSMVARLPVWMKSKKNRKQILTAITQLEKRLPKNLP